MASGDEYPSSLDMKMEDVIVQQNNELLTLQEHLETKNRQLAELSSELDQRRQIVGEFEESLTKQDEIIQILNKDLCSKEMKLKEMHNDISRYKKALEEMDSMEAVLRKKDTELKKCSDELAKLQHEIATVEATASQRETQLRLDHEKELFVLKNDYSLQMKVMTEKSSLIENILEQQITILLNRIKEYSDHKFLVNLNFDISEVDYKRKMNDLKTSIYNTREDLLSESFLGKIKEIIANLPNWLSLEQILTVKLNSQSKQLKEIEEELQNIKHLYSEAINREKNLKTNLNEVEREIQLLREEKLQLQRHLTSSNANYEKITIDFNRERLEMEKKYEQSIESYECDVALLNNSLKFFINTIPKYFNILDEEEEMSTTGNPFATFVPEVHKILNTNVCDGYRLVCVCMSDFDKHFTKVKRIFEENKSLLRKFETQKKTLDEKSNQLKKTLDDLEFTKKRWSLIDEEKNYIQNKLSYVLEENKSLLSNIESLNNTLVELKNDIKNYQSEISSLKNEIKLLSEKDEKIEVLGENVESNIRRESNVDDRSFLSLPEGFTTSTPLNPRFILDPKAGGDHTVLPTQLHLSTLKWMERCQEIDKKNQILLSQISNLELNNNDLKYTVDCVREEMITFQQKQSNLELKLNSYIALKKKFESLVEDNELKDIQIKSITQELQLLKNEYTELSNKNVEIEELFRQSVNNTNLGSETVFSESAMRLFNEKVRELIVLKRQMSSIEADKKNLSLKVDLLIESNNNYVQKLRKQSAKICSLQDELDKVNEEKLGLVSANKLLKKEIDLQNLRIGYFSSNREKADSGKVIDEMYTDLVAIFRCSIQNSQSKQTIGGETSETDLKKVLNALNEEINGEQMDLIEKMEQLRSFIDSTKEKSVVGEDWLMGVDKLCRSIIENQKYHRQQYSRLETLLGSLSQPGPALVTKRLEEDLLKLKNERVELVDLKKKAEEKENTIKMLSGEKSALEELVRGLETRVLQLEVRAVKGADGGAALGRVRSLSRLEARRKEVEDELSALSKRSQEYDLATEAARREIESEYTSAFSQLRLFLQADLSSKLYQREKAHTQQVEELERLIGEQAAEIAVLIGKNQNLPLESSPPDPRLLLSKEEVKEQFECLLSGVKVVHRAELELARLETKLGSPIQVNEPTFPASSVSHSSESASPNLLNQMTAILKQDFNRQVKDFLAPWHSSFSNLAQELQDAIELKTEKLRENFDSEPKLDEGQEDEYIDNLKNILDSAEHFVGELQRGYNEVLQRLEVFASIYQNSISDCFASFESVHFDSSALRKLQDELENLKEDKEELRNCQQALVKVVSSDLSSLRDEVIKAASFSASLHLQLDSSHREELDHLRNYYVQMCSNLEKQYTEDVNSLQSKLASLSSGGAGGSPSPLSLELDLPLAEMESDNDWAVELFTLDQMEFIKGLKKKWLEEIHDLKVVLENKYSQKMKDIHHVLSAYLYKNELDICARCLKDEVMRECEAEIEAIGKELDMKARDYDDKTMISPFHGQVNDDCPDQITSSPSSLTSFVGNLIFSLANNSSILSQFLANLENTFTNIENKLKDKENKLLNIQNKMNFLFSFVLKNSEGSSDMFLNLIQEKINDGLLLPDDLQKIYDLIAQNKVDFEEKSDENQMMSGQQFFSDDYEKLIKERDGLKEMTNTLKSAVSQLVMYLNTCEDELNKTVVDELLKICDEGSKCSSVSPRRVHFAPSVEELDESRDLSMSLRVQLDSCLAKLKMEAASLLGLSSLHQVPSNLLHNQIESLKKENKTLHDEITALKQHIKCHHTYNPDSNEEIFSNDFTQNHSPLIERVNYIISKSRSTSSDTAKSLDDLAKYGDKIISDLYKEIIDLQQQISVADKQLKSTRQFLEEQAQERENERDEFSRELKQLQEQLKEINQKTSSQERFSSQIQCLENQLSEIKMALEKSEKVKEIAESELKDAIEKIWVLRDIISDLEGQLSRKSEKEELLERKLDQLEAELDHHSDTHIAMAQELESLRSQNMEDSYLEQIKQLQENIKVQFDSSVVRSIKTQILEMESCLERRIKDLENVYLTLSGHSLSSPSEEMSVTEGLQEADEEESPPSPVGLPVHELTKLQEKLERHGTVEQLLMKRYRDLQLSCTKLTLQLEEMLAEREVIQKQMKKQMVQLAEANNKIDDLRHKVDVAQNAANKGLIEEIKEFKMKYSALERAYDDLQSEFTDQKSQLLHAEDIIKKQQMDLEKNANTNHQIVKSLKNQLDSVTEEKNKLQELLSKQREENDFEVMSALLADKNEDIEHLQRTVNELKNVEIEKKRISVNSKGHTVSFADDMTSLNADEKLRDAPHQHSFLLEPHKSPIIFEKSQMSTESPIPLDIPQNQTLSEENPYHIVVEKLKLELNEKDNQIIDLEKEIDYLKSVQNDLKSTKTQMENVLSSVSEDKAYYENHLKSLNEDINNKNSEIKLLKKQISEKDSEVLKIKSDVKVLEEISLNLQEKLKQAKELAEQEDLVKLENEILRKEKELNEVKQKLTAYENDLTDEKELADTLKSSLNVVTKEKMMLEEKLSLFEIENRNLSKTLQTADAKLDHYSIVVKNLKNFLDSKCPQSESPHSSLRNSDEDDLFKLKETVMRIANRFELLNSERLKFNNEIEELKTLLLSNKNNATDFNIQKLEEELIQMRNTVTQIKEEKLAVFANFSSEVDKLNKDIATLKESKRTLTETLNNELSEKQELNSMYSKLLEDFTREKQNIQGKNKVLECITANKIDIKPVSLTKNLSCCLASKTDILPSKSVKNLSFCVVNKMDIAPTSGPSDDERVSVSNESPLSSGLDDLTERVRNEIQLSKSLDNSLLHIHIDDEDNLGRTENIYSPVSRKLENLHKAFIDEVKKCEEVKKSLNDKTDKCRTLEMNNSKLKIELDRFVRVVTNQNEKIEQLRKQVDFLKEKVVTLELTILREQSNLKQTSLLLQHERSKGMKTQCEDIGLIETMRQRLQCLMENEIKLKQLVLDERSKCERLTAELNSIKALEKFKTDSNALTNTNIDHLLENEKKKYSALKIEYEKEKQSREDLQNVLTRERANISVLQNNLTKTQKLHREIEKELLHLKKNFNEEIVKRRIAESKVIELEGDFHSRFERITKNTEHEKQREIEAAYAIVSELEREQSQLMRKHSDLKLEFREIEEGFKSRISRLEEERAMLLEDRVRREDEIKRLQEECRTFQRENEDLMLSPRRNELSNSSVIVREVERLVDGWLLAERRRKALAYQKEYLLITLRTYQPLRLRLTPRTKHRSFKSLAWVIIALLKFQKLPGVRLLRSHRKKNLILDKLKKVVFSSEVDRLAIAPHSNRERRQQASLHSPPSKDYKFP